MQLTQQTPADNGFYFLSYYANTVNSSGFSEVSLKQIKLTKSGMLVVEDDETLDGYPEAGFSLRTPDYVTSKFATLVNTYILSQNYDVSIEMAINEAVGYDDSFTVFIGPSHSAELMILTQHPNGKVDQSIIRGQNALQILANFL
jgi:hypothetical protein